MTHTRACTVGTAFVLATLVLGCSDRETPTPTAPSVPSPAPPPPSPPPSSTIYSLSGEVFEVFADGSRRPVEGVEVYCDPCGPPLGHSARHTDAAGVYSFDGAGGVAPGAVPLVLAKRGYVLPNQPDRSGPNGDGWMGSITVTVTGDTRYDIQIVRK